jgi:uroporphyrinogen-III synthase
MDTKPPSASPDALAGRLIAVPEARHLDVLASLLEKRGARVLRCPLISIRDAEPAQPVVDWLARFIDSPPGLLILYTGEGVARLAGFAERAGLKERFVEALGKTRKLARGPKPVRALRRLGVDVEIEPPEPTTDGIIAALHDIDLEDLRVGVQLYGTEPNPTLLEYLTARGARCDTVAPYTYASAADDDEVVGLIEKLGRGEIDAIAFTSTAQLDRLRKVARERNLEETLRHGLETTRVAAIGPVVAAALGKAEIAVEAVPAESFHMIPLVEALVSLLSP